MKEEWLMTGAVVPLNAETTAALISEIKRLVNVVGGIALEQAQPPLAWVYPEGLEALKNGKPWTAYGTRQEPNNIALYLSPQPAIEPYGWVTFTAYGDEDDVWYENPEGQLPEGWTYKPLYDTTDTTPPQRTWAGLTDEEQIQVAWSCGAMSADWLEFAKTIEAKLKEKNT